MNDVPKLLVLLLVCLLLVSTAAASSPSLSECEPSAGGSIFQPSSSCVLDVTALEQAQLRVLGGNGHRLPTVQTRGKGLKGVFCYEAGFSLSFQGFMYLSSPHFSTTKHASCNIELAAAKVQLHVRLLLLLLLLLHCHNSCTLQLLCVIMVATHLHPSAHILILAHAIVVCVQESRVYI